MTTGAAAVVGAGIVVGMGVGALVGTGGGNVVSSCGAGAKKSMPQYTTNSSKATATADNGSQRATGREVFCPSCSRLNAINLSASGLDAGLLADWEFIPG